MAALVYGQNRTITEAATIRTIRMDRTDTIITISALTTFRLTDITDIISGVRRVVQLAGSIA